MTKQNIGLKKTNNSLKLQAQVSLLKKKNISLVNIFKDRRENLFSYEASITLMVKTE